MNKQIQELAEQARDYATTRHSVSNIVLAVNGEKFEAKFAELIVNKCLSIIETEAAQYAEPVWAFEIANDIKEHFEVTQND